MNQLELEYEDMHRAPPDSVIVALKDGTVNQLRAALSDVRDETGELLSSEGQFQYEQDPHQILKQTWIIAEGIELSKRLTDMFCEAHASAEPDSLYHALINENLAPSYCPVDVGPLREPRTLPRSLKTKLKERMDTDINDPEIIVRNFAAICPEFEPALTDGFPEFIKVDEDSIKGNTASTHLEDSSLKRLQILRHQREMLIDKSSRPPPRSQPARVSWTIKILKLHPMEPLIIRVWQQPVPNASQVYRAPLVQPSFDKFEAESVTDLDLSSLDLDAHSSFTQLHKRRKPRAWSE